MNGETETLRGESRETDQPPRGEDQPSDAERTEEPREGDHRFRDWALI
jgi:hypothetical protein